MRKDQEARILHNQALIMRALAMALNEDNGGGAMRSELRRRADDNDTFVRDYLK